MYDHERSLVNKLKEAGKPFAMIGVNWNDELENIKQAKVEKGLNWRSFFCGKDYSIPELYNVQGFPTIVFIDAKGIVRGASRSPNDEFIEELLAEVK